MTVLKLGSKLFKLTSAALVGVLLASNLTSYSLLLTPKAAYAAASYQTNFRVDKAQAARSETVTYELILTNNGDVPLTNFNVYQITRPQNTSYVNGSGILTVGSSNFNVPDAWFSDPVGTNLGGLTAGQAMTFKWSVKVDDNAPQGATINETVAVKTAELGDPNIYPITFTVAVNPSRNSLCATISVDKATANVGDTVTYTVRVCNDGDIDQDNVTLYDRLPSQLTYKAGTTRATVGTSTVTVNDNWIGSVSGGSGTGYNMGRLSPTQAVTVTFQAAVNSTATNNQTIEDFAQVNSTQHPEMVVCAVAFKVVIPAPAALNPNCSLTKKIKLPNGEEKTSISSTDHTYAPGEEIVYRLFVSNPGTGDAVSFSMSDFLPPYVSWVSGEGGYAPNENKVNFDLGTLKAGESRTLTYRAKVRETIPSNVTEQKNSVKVTSPSGFDSCKAESNLWVGKPGAILAAAALPQTGTVPPSVLATLGLVAGGLIVRLKKFRVNKYRGN